MLSLGGMYNMIPSVNATNMTGFLQYLNNTHDNLLGLAILFIIMIVVGASLIRWGEIEAAGVALLIGAISAIILANIGIIDVALTVTIVILCVIGIVLVFSSTMYK